MRSHLAPEAVLAAPVWASAPADLIAAFDPSVDGTTILNRTKAGSGYAAIVLAPKHHTFVDDAPSAPTGSALPGWTPIGSCACGVIQGQDALSSPLLIPDSGRVAYLEIESPN